MCKKIDHEYTKEIVCPWCGTEYSDSWQQENEGKEICETCGKSFEYQRDYDVTYVTVKSKYGTCNKCGKENVVMYNESSTILKVSDVCEDCFGILRRQGLEKYYKRIIENNGNLRGHDDKA